MKPCINSGKQHGVKPGGKMYGALAIVFGLCAITILYALSGETTASLPSKPATRVAIELPEDTVEKQAQYADSHDEKLTWQEYKIRRGDNLSLIFKRLGLSPRTLHDIMQSGEDANSYQHLRPDQVLSFGYNQNSQLVGVKYEPRQAFGIESRHDGESWTTESRKLEVETRHEYASGVIQDSLFLAGARAGLNDSTIMQLAGIFGWDIDFALDIRKGDSFSLIYETHHLNGERISDGNIIAAEFTNRGKSYRAVRYTSKNGDSDYFTPDGKSMRKAFLRTPVKFSRISSRFTNKRWHPVLKRWRAHRGVDYAAPRGTPVLATSNGKVTFRGKKGGYGKVIFISNGSKYTTVYGHLNNFARNVRKGSRVKQGQVIGYVGSTGLATGPHLHYELRINGVHRNPLTAKLPQAKPIAKKYLDSFRQEAGPWLEQLTLITRTQLAQIDKPADSLSN